jgi:hypothetical protein
MNTRLLAWIILMVAVGLCQTACTQDATDTIVVTITAVKESDWQRESAVNQMGLRERLQAKTLVELSGELKQTGELILRDGQERGIVENWDFADDGDEVIAKKTIQELIGTEVRVEKIEAGEVRLRLTLTHDIQPPRMQSMTYATAAKGAERDKLSVTAPRFERLRWQGEVTASKDERVIASFPSPGDADTRLVVFLRGGSDSTPAPDVEIRQTIYRVPELDMIEWLLDGETSDAAVIKRLQEKGRASMVSQLTTTAAKWVRTQAQSGFECWLPREMNPDYDALYQLPVSFETVLAGTRLENSEDVWISSFSPRAPLAVQWPTSWLNVYDIKTYKPTGKAVHGWMDWYDRFDLEINGEVAFRDATPHLVAMMSPADQTWGAERKGRWLDVTVAQRLNAKILPPAPPQVSSVPADPFAPVDPLAPIYASHAQPPLLVLGIALDQEKAQALLATRQPGKDAALLRDLVAQVKAGQAHVVTCALSANQINRRALNSARHHSCPTEMPSIPSAWNEMPVGTRFEQEGEDFTLTQDLAPPARTEWKLARDVPEAIMWEPRFRKLSINSRTHAAALSGTHLVAVADIPEVMSASDLPTDETVLLFTHRPASDTAPKATKPDYEIEALIFEIPAAEAEAWQQVKSDDFASFTQQRLKSGSAKLKAHAMLRQQPASEGRLQVVEEYMTATEFDPPEPEAPFRMRPTALETLPVGLYLETDLSEEIEGIANANITLRLATAKPIEPGLEETLKIAASGKEDYPGAKHEFDEWRVGALRLAAGSIHCLGLPHVFGGSGVTTRVAFVRARQIR